MELYGHNQLAYDKAIQMLKSNKRAAIIHPTGTGKSFIGFKLAQEHPSNQFLWLTPSDYIVRTQLQNIKAISGCLPQNITFFTYSKLMLQSTFQLKELKCDYIVLDEFHRCGAEKWGEGVKRLLQTLPKAYVLGLSATNIRYLDNNRDMAEELFDGNIASEITMGEAIAKCILPAPKYITAIYGIEKELEKYQKKITTITIKKLRDNSQKKLDELRRALAQADGVDKVFKRHITKTNSKLIVFCANYAHLQEMREKALDWFKKIDLNPSIYTVYSEFDEADKEFSAFKSDNSEHLKLLFCIDMLNEGVHVSGIDGVVLLRPTVSPIVFKQQLGRALSTGQKHTPLIFDIVNNFENLYSIGTVQEEELSAIGRIYSPESMVNSYNSKFILIDEVRDCRRLFEQLQQSLGASWEQHYLAAKSFYCAHGHLQVPKGCKTADGLSLGSWITTQRRVYAGQVNGSLDNERISKLNDIGMQWNNRLEVAWERNYEAAKHYFELHGNLDIKAQYITEEGIRLGNWIVNQRQLRAGRLAGGLLTDEKIARLDEIGMLWSAVCAKWEQNYAQAAAYYVEHGNLNVPAGYKTKNGFALGAWVRNLRRARNSEKRASSLTKEQILRLDNIGMQWEDCFKAQWQKNYKAVQQYYIKFGDTNIPISYKTPDGVALGKWYYRQKNNLSQNVEI